MYLNLIILFVNLLVLALVLVSLLKIRKIHIRQFPLDCVIEKNANDIFSQIEALMGVYADLKFTKSLPETRGWAGSPDFLWKISRIAQEKKPIVVFECSSGVSTVVLAQSLMLNGQGHIYSLDHDPVFAEKTRQELKRHGLTDWATVIDAPLANHQINGEEWLWYSLDNMPEDMFIDMLVIDGPPNGIGENARYPAGPLLFNHLTKDGLIILDDANRPSEINICSRWMMEFSNYKRIDMGCEKGLVLLSK